MIDSLLVFYALPPPCLPRAGVQPVPALVRFQTGAVCREQVHISWGNSIQTISSARVSASSCILIFTNSHILHSALPPDSPACSSAASLFSEENLLGPQATYNDPIKSCVVYGRQKNKKCVHDVNFSAKFDKTRLTLPLGFPRYPSSLASYYLPPLLLSLPLLLH